MSSRALHRTLQAGDVHLWTSYLLADPNEQAEAFSILSKAEQIRARLLWGERNRSRFVQARAFVRTVLSNYLDADAELLTLAYGPHGKPFVSESLNGDDLQFSLAHSGDYCLLAVALARPLGVDVEQIRLVPEAADLARRYFTPAETQLLELSDNDRRQQLFFALWTHKEAMVKAMGASLADELAQIEFEVDARGTLRLSAHQSRRSVSDCEVMHIDTVPGYVAALASLGSINNLERHLFNSKMD